MRGMFTVFYYTILRNLRDRSSLLEMLLLPVVLILILGTALAPAFEQGELSPTAVGYFNEDEGPAGVYFELFIGSDDIEAVLDVKPVRSSGEGLEQLRQGETWAFIHLPQDFSAAAEPGKKSAIRVTFREGSPLRASVVENVLESFIHGANTMEAGYRLGAGEIEYMVTGSAIEERPVAASGIRPGAMGYYAVTMMVMIVMYGAIYACSGMGTSYLAAAGKRIKATPVSTAQHYLGLVLANVTTVFAQVLILLAFTHYVFDVNWGDNILLILLIALTLVLLSTGLGTAIVMLARDDVLATSILNVLVPVSTFVAGGYITIINPGPLFAALQHLSPNYLAQTAIFNTVYGGRPGQTMAMLGGMGLFIMAAFAVALLAERRKQN